MLPSLDEFGALLPSIFLFAYLLPLCHGVDDSAHPTFGVARDLWTQWINLSSVTQKEWAVGVIKAQLKAFITDTQVRPLLVVNYVYLDKFRLIPPSDQKISFSCCPKTCLGSGPRLSLRYSHRPQS